MTKKNNDSYQEYLLKKHSKFQTDMDSVGKIVKKIKDSDIKSIEKVIQGEVNEVYDVETNSNQKLIVRISRSSRPNFETEKIYIDKVRELGVPAPKVLLVERVKDNLTFCVEEKIPGVTFKSIREKLLDPEKRKLISQAGFFLSKIHSVKVDTFGSLAKHEPHKNWTEIIAQVQRNPKNPDLYIYDGVDQSKVDNAIKILMKNLEVFDCTKPRLLHSDWSPKHWLIENNKIVGILDFEGCKGGDPVYDFGWVHFFYGEDIPLEWLKEGYADRNEINRNFDLKISLYDLFFSLWLLDYYISEENASGVNHCISQLDKGLKKF